MDLRDILSIIVATNVYALLLKFLQKNSPHNVQTKGGMVKGFLNNVLKNCTFLAWRLPLSNILFSWGFNYCHVVSGSVMAKNCSFVSELRLSVWEFVCLWKGAIGWVPGSLFVEKRWENKAHYYWPLGSQQWVVNNIYSFNFSHRCTIGKAMKISKKKNV